MRSCVNSWNRGINRVVLNAPVDITDEGPLIGLIRFADPELKLSGVQPLDGHPFTADNLQLEVALLFVTCIRRHEVEYNLAGGKRRNSGNLKDRLRSVR